MHKKSPSAAQTPRDTSRLVLEARLGQQHATALVDEALELRGRPLWVDASKVEAVSTLCLQALLAVAASWRAGEQELRIVDASPAFLIAVERLGLDLVAFQSPEAATCP